MGVTYLALYTINPLSRRLNGEINVAIHRNPSAMKTCGMAIITIQMILLSTTLFKGINEVQNKVRELSTCKRIYRVRKTRTIFEPKKYT